MQPTLRRRMAVHLGLMVGSALLIALIAIIGVEGVHNDLNLALQGNQQLRQVFDIGMEVEKARGALSAAQPNQAVATASLEMALVKLETATFSGPNMPPPAWLDESRRTAFHDQLRNVLNQLQHPTNGGSGIADAQSSAVDSLLVQLANITSDVRRTIATKQQTADETRRRTLITTILLAVIIVLGAILIGVRQYRSVMRPLNRIAKSVQSFAAGNFGERIAPETDVEFAALARDFNLMACELEALYRELEEKVVAKSKELARSQRLASVGYLAAGVAHEMNNPLGIIAGYGERSLQHLARGLDDTSLPSAQRAIKIICEEAFRCKEITARLLSLARPGNGNRNPVAVESLVEEVIANLGGLPEYSNRCITIKSRAGAELHVLAKDGELRQVVMNLMLNALEATTPGTGQVHVSVSAAGATVEITIFDNGSGMNPQTLDRIFEPFFTDKRGQQRPGTGLGLSISHAIVLDHGGRISAQSDGPGKGSRFTICLPIATKGAEVANIP
jgi:two-component system, NtrC family, sensor kinase